MLIAKSNIKLKFKISTTNSLASFFNIKNIHTIEFNIEIIIRNYMYRIKEKVCFKNK